MALPRPYWKGYLKLSLVSCPIAIYASTSSNERIAFKQVNRTTGNRLRQQLVDEETGDLVESADKARGFEVGKNDYLLVEDDELDAVAIESSHTIDIDSFVSASQIGPRFLDAPDYLVLNEDDPGLTRKEVQRRLRALHPMLVLADVPIAPSIELSPATLALLGWLRRGLQPARFVVLPRRER